MSTRTKILPRIYQAIVEHDITQITLKELANLVNVHPNSLGRYLKILEKEGHSIRIKVVRNRIRYYDVEITPEGRKFAKAYTEGEVLEKPKKEKIEEEVEITEEYLLGKLKPAKPKEEVIQMNREQIKKEIKKQEERVAKLDEQLKQEDLPELTRIDILAEIEGLEKNIKELKSKKVVVKPKAKPKPKAKAKKQRKIYPETYTQKITEGIVKREKVKLKMYGDIIRMVNALKYTKDVYPRFNFKSSKEMRQHVNDLIDKIFELI